MSFRVKKYLPVLKHLSKLSDRVQREYIRKSDKEFIDGVSECAKNVIKGNVPPPVIRRQTCVRKEVPEDDEEDIVEPTPPPPVLRTPPDTANAQAR